MKKQTIRNFLNLPGIVGLALMDEQSRPYFCGIDRVLNFQQQEALTEGIQQVLSTTPEGFDAFDFRFSQRDAYIYKLKSGIILLVITDEQLEPPTYQTAITELKQTLEANPQSVVPMFRLLSGSTTLDKQQYWTNGHPEPETKPPAEELPASRSPELPLPVVTQVSYQWKQVIVALNALTDATARYLGRLVVANAWQSTRPNADSLDHLKISRSGHFSCSPQVSIEASMSSEAQQELHNWVERFITRCSLVIRDYAGLVLQQMLDEHQRNILRIEKK